VKKYNLIFLSVIACILFGLSSCKKINEATTLGSDIIPPIDNINTFETFFNAETFNRSNLNDSSTISFYDNLAIGHIESDPVFGKTNAEAYFSIGRPFYGYPFVGHKDSITIDSVILALHYQTSYGDTNSTLTFNVSEISQTSGFREDTFYRYNVEPFATTTSLGSKTFPIHTLNDSPWVFTPGDTSKKAKPVGLSLRIPLDNSLGVRFKNYDTSNAYKNDAAFKDNFKGIAIRASQSGNGLAYFSAVSNQSKLVIYYTSTVNGKDSTYSTEFYHIPLVLPAGYRNGQANIIKRTPGGDWANALASPNTKSDKLYIQSTLGSIGYIRIPQLDTFSNKVIHRAELIIPKLSSAQDNIFGSPQLLWLDRINQADNVPSTLQHDVFFTTNSYNVDRFGGNLKGNTYQFAITRHVQGIVTRKETNDTLRLHAPYRVTLYDNNFKGKQLVSVLDEVAKGRVVVGGGNHPTDSIRLRIVYSNY
jgi:hypothetical protein